MDYSNKRSLHQGAVPRTGGVAIVITFCVGTIAYYLIHRHHFVEQHAFWGLLLSALIIAIVSFYDDVTDKAFTFKLLSQLVGVIILLGFDLTINELTIPFYGPVTLGFMRYPLTILWIVGITNAFNFMDGLNGLAGGTAVIVALFFTFFTFDLGSRFVFHVSYIVAAACLGFLFFNFPKGLIFMGDIGSTFLGFTLGALAILAANYDHSHTSFMVMPLLFANFIMETLFTFIWRMVQRQPIHKAHKFHPYQLLRQMGVSSTRIVLVYYTQTIILGILTMFYLHASVNVKFLILAMIMCSYLIYFMFVHRAASRCGLLSTLNREKFNIRLTKEICLDR